ncbi:hypothetical protein [Streptosporangium canum]
MPTVVALFPEAEALLEVILGVRGVRRHVEGGAGFSSHVFVHDIYDLG